MKQITQQELEAAAKSRDSLERRLCTARAEVAKFAKRAHSEGAGVTEIAKLAGVSRVTLYEMLKR